MPAPIGNNNANVVNGSCGFSQPSGVPDVPSFAGREPVNIANITPSSQPNDAPSNAGAVPDYPVPAYAAWFSLDSIHGIEKRAFPEFFPPSCTDSAETATVSQYRHARNFVIQTWRSSAGSPPEAFGDGRRSFIENHSFLERWGLINWIPDAHSRIVQQNIQPEPSQPKEAPVAVKAPVIWDRSGSANAKPSCGSTKLNIFCNTCGLNLSKDPSLNLCMDCFGDGRFSSQYFSGDFVKLGISSEDGGWSDQELLYLFEGIEMFASESSGPEAWERISTHVQTRSSSECIRKFITLPDMQAEKTASFELFSNSLASSSNNPIAALVATLSSAVHPDVGAQAAKMALSTLKQDLSNQDEVVSQIVSAFPSLVDTQLTEEEKKTRQSLALLAELLARKVDAKISLLYALENSLSSELSYLKTSSSASETVFQDAPPKSANIEALHQ
ncbi:SWI/SNF and RSC complex subunit Ssr2 [Mitosporidium daphniae]